MIRCEKALYSVMLRDIEDMIMAKEYLEKLSAILNRVTARKFMNVKFECKHFFSGAAVYADGRICISLTPAGFAIKLPANQRDVLLQKKGTKCLRYFPEAPIKKDYVVLPDSMLKDTKTLRSWIKLTVEYVLTLPKPVKKKRSSQK